MPADFGPLSGQLWPELGNIQVMSAKFGLTLAKFWQALGEFGGIWSELDQTWPCFVQLFAMSAEFGPYLAKCWSTLDDVGQHWFDFDRICAVRIRPTFGVLGRNWAKSGQLLANDWRFPPTWLWRQPASAHGAGRRGTECGGVATSSATSSTTRFSGAAAASSQHPSASGAPCSSTRRSGPSWGVRDGLPLTFAHVWGGK